MRQNPNEKIIRMWTAAAVLTVAAFFSFYRFAAHEQPLENILLSNRNGRNK